MLTYSHQENCLRYVSVVVVLITLAVATACSGPEETSTTTPPVTTTSAAPTTATTPAAQADPNTQWAESVCSAARNVRSSLDAIGGNLELDATATPSALDQVKSTLKAQVAAARASMVELGTAIEAIPVDTEGAAELKNKGAGGHASMPHDATDPIPVACEIVSAIQTMVTRKISVFDPAVITIAKIEAGTTNNIIPETARMQGTIRTLSPRQRARVAEELQRLVPGIAAAHGCSADIHIEPGFPVTVCDARAVRFGQQVVEDMFGAESWITLDTPIMGAEDFAYVLEKVPGAMFFLGAAHEGDDWRSCCGLHSNRMVLDDSVMARGAALHAAIAERFLAEGFDA